MDREAQQIIFALNLWDVFLCLFRESAYRPLPCCSNSQIHSCWV